MARTIVQHCDLHRMKDKEDGYEMVFKLFKCNFCHKMINPYRIPYIQLTFENKTKEYLHSDCYVNLQCNGMIYYNTEHKFVEPNTLNVNDIEDFEKNIPQLDLS